MSVAVAMSHQSLWQTAFGSKLIGIPLPTNMKLLTTFEEGSISRRTYVFFLKYIPKVDLGLLPSSSPSIYIKGRWLDTTSFYIATDLRIWDIVILRPLFLEHHNLWPTWHRFTFFLCCRFFWFHYHLHPSSAPEKVRDSKHYHHQLFWGNFMRGSACPAQN